MRERSMDVKDLVKRSGINAPYKSELLNWGIKEPAWVKALTINGALGMVIIKLKKFQISELEDT